MKRRIFFSDKKGHVIVWYRHDQIFLWIECMIAILQIQCDKSANNIFMSNGVTNIQNKMIFFFKSWNLFSNFYIKMGSSAADFSLFTGLSLANVSKRITFFAITEAGTALSPCPGFRSGSAHHTPTFACCEQWVHIQGQAGPLSRASAMMAWGRRWPQDRLGWAGPHAACRPWAGHACFSPR